MFTLSDHHILYYAGGDVICAKCSHPIKHHVLVDDQIRGGFINICKMCSLDKTPAVLLERRIKLDIDNH